MTTQHFDIHQSITDKIIAAIEAGAGDFVMPWHRKTGGFKPRNVSSGNFYQGINILALWIEAQANTYSSNVWGTYRQWASVGAQVRKGAKSSHVVFYKQIVLDSDDPEQDERMRLFARATPVFNADQVENWQDPSPAATPLGSGANTLGETDALIASSGAIIHHGGSRAYYAMATDSIHLPDRAAFIGSLTSTATEAYYSTLCHELTHWTGIPSRCDRNLNGRFGSQAYAIEELVAELGAAFLCAEYGIATEPRLDHAQYLASWLSVLKNDKRAIFTAVSAASKAVAYLRGINGP